MLTWKKEPTGQYTADNYVVFKIWGSWAARLTTQERRLGTARTMKAAKAICQVHADGLQAEGAYTLHDWVVAYGTRKEDFNAFWNVLMIPGNKTFPPHVQGIASDALAAPRLLGLLADALEEIGAARELSHVRYCQTFAIRQPVA